MAFVDEAVVFVRAGRGGAGSASFHSEPFKPRGGPDGGDGGRGGDVILEVSSEVFDLAALADHPHQRAEPGGHGQGKRRKGAEGKDLVIPVPDGTLILEERGLVADLVGEGARVVVARGGRGGRGNASLASSRNRAPKSAEPGETGEERRLSLELRLVADLGLVGLPNAGKSTLLAALTAARPKVADYPFTTLTPNLGVAGDDDARYVVADVPGLIEGAHTGKGLGDRFLRHIARCRALAFVVDLSAADPSADLTAVRAEVTAHDPALAGRPWVAVGTKADLVADPDVRARAIPAEVVVVSAVTGQGLDDLRARLERLVQQESPPVGREPYVVLRPARDTFSVRRDARGFVVEGSAVERWVAETDLEDEIEVARLQKRLRREGVETRLAEAGARSGDEVVIAGHAFEFLPDQEPG